MVNYLKMDIWFKYQMLIEDYQMVKLLNQDLISEIISILMKIFVVISLYLVEEDLNQLTFKMCQKCSKKMVLQDLNILLKVLIYFSLMVQEKNLSLQELFFLKTHQLIKEVLQVQVSKFKQLYA